jgi:hypothetical protein
MIDTRTSQPRKEERQKLRGNQADAGSHHPTIADWMAVELGRWRLLGFHGTPLPNLLAIHD